MMSRPAELSSYSVPSHPSPKTKVNKNMPQHSLPIIIKDRPEKELRLGQQQMKLISRPFSRYSVFLFASHNRKIGKCDCYLLGWMLNVECSSRPRVSSCKMENTHLTDHTLRVNTSRWGGKTNFDENNVRWMRWAKSNQIRGRVGDVYLGSSAAESDSTKTLYCAMSTIHEWNGRKAINSLCRNEIAITPNSPDIKIKRSCSRGAKAINTKLIISDTDSLNVWDVVGCCLMT